MFKYSNHEGCIVHTRVCTIKVDKPELDKYFAKACVSYCLTTTNMAIDSCKSLLLDLRDVVDEEVASGMLPTEP